MILAAVCTPFTVGPWYDAYVIRSLRNLQLFIILILLRVIQHGDYAVHC